jgi:hypothetical protein
LIGPEQCTQQSLHEDSDQMDWQKLENQFWEEKNTPASD